MAVSYSWELLSSSSSSSSSTAGGSSSTTSSSTGAKRPRFLPRGLLLPFRRDGKGDFANGEGEALAFSKVALVLGTERGELPWDHRFGASLDRIRHRGITLETKTLVLVIVTQAFIEHLPSFELTQLEVTNRGEDGKVVPGTLRITIGFNERLVGGGQRFATDVRGMLTVQG